MRQKTSSRVHNSTNHVRPELANFLDSILSDLDSLILFAGLHPLYLGFHRMLSKRFPFGVCYEMEDDVVYVYAILDLRSG